MEIEIINHLPKSYQIFYKICEEAGIDLLEDDKSDEMKKGGRKIE